jgi:signal peptidase I
MSDVPDAIVVSIDIKPAPKHPPRRPPIRRELLLAGLLGLLSSACGELYAGHWIRACLACVYTTLLVPLTFLILLGLPWSHGNMALVLILVFGGRLAWIVDPVLAIARDPERARRHPRWYCFVGVLVAELLATTTVLEVNRTLVGEMFTTPFRNMSPRLLPDDRFVVNKSGAGSRRWQRFDIVAYRKPSDPERLSVGRIIGLPGESLEVRPDGVLINGEPLSEPPVVDRTPDPYGVDDLVSSTSIPTGHLFVMGDHRAWSQDSRHFGPVSIENVAESVEVIYYSREMQDVPDSRGKVVRRSGAIRWSRIGLRVH